jgi:hypothetical protein
MFRSRVQVNDPAIGESQPAVIEMNHELSYGGYKFFQSSYQQTGNREMSVLTVSRDPGQLLVFVGYILLIAGMITVFVTRIVQRRGLGVGVTPVSPPPGATGSGLEIVGLWLLALVLAGMATPVDQLTAVVPDEETLETLRRVPVQHDGRVMPLDTLAREAVWRVTGKHRWQGLDPVTVALGWSFAPAAWSQEPIVPLGSRALAAELGFPSGTRHEPRSGSRSGARGPYALDAGADEQAPAAGDALGPGSHRALDGAAATRLGRRLGRARSPAALCSTRGLPQ